MDPLDYLTVRFHYRGYVVCSDKALENTTLHWKYPGGDDMANALLVLNDQISMEMMAKHVTDGGLIDIYVVIPPDESPEGNDWQFEFAGEYEAVHRVQDQEEELQAEHYQVEQVHAEEGQAELRNADEIFQQPHVLLSLLPYNIVQVHNKPPEKWCCRIIQPIVQLTATNASNLVQFQQKDPT
ncbi:hypothetical protein D1007_57055 [Hordeum vulgare]|nr:hypothetical protein D1007_57055 [Hordeum vulgare]